MKIRQTTTAPQALIFVGEVSPLCKGRDAAHVQHERLVAHRDARVIMCGGIVKAHGKLIAMHGMVVRKTV